MSKRQSQLQLDLYKVDGFNCAELKVQYIPADSGNVIQSSSDAEASLRPLFTESASFREEFYMLCLNRRNAVIGWYRISSGGVAGTVVDPKIIFGIALSAVSSAIIIAHNHPSGNPKPSQADIKVTGEISKAGQLLDISLLDHLIMTSESFTSFADEGLL